MSTLSLLTGHRVQGETSRDFSHAAGAVGDDDELNDHEDRKDDETDGVVTADDDGAELLDDLARIAVQQDRTRRADVEREPEERHDQDQRREDAERERVLRVQRGQHDDQRHRDVQREQHVEHPRRDGHDHQDNENNRRTGYPNLGGRGDSFPDGRGWGLGGRGRYSGHEVTVTSLKVSAEPPYAYSRTCHAIVRFLSL